jgi:hypothetical protein
MFVFRGAFAVSAALSFLNGTYMWVHGLDCAHVSGMSAQMHSCSEMSVLCMLHYSIHQQVPQVGS